MGLYKVKKKNGHNSYAIAPKEFAPFNLHVVKLGVSSKGQ
jgi:hypothetical protein